MTLRIKFASRAALLGCCSAVAMATAVQAAEPETRSAELGTRLEEVVVTATRTAQNIQSVPVAVSAFDSAAIEKHGMGNVEDMQFHVPNLRIREEAPVGGMTISMRGISAAADNFSNDSGVGIYVNEVFVARGNDFGATFYDVQEVQVLRGPQGTLFGRNTPAGAVLVETQGPGSTYGGYIKAGLGGGGGSLGKGADRTIYRFDGAVDLPISPILGVRLAGYYENDDGFGRSRLNGHKFFSKDDSAVRATFDFRPIDGLDAKLVLDYNKQNRGGPLRLGIEYVAPFTAQPFDELNGGKRARDALIALAANHDPYFNDSPIVKGLTAEASSASLNVSYKISDNWNLRSISGWRHIIRDQFNDQAGTPFLVGPGTTASIRQVQISQEFVLTGDITDRLHTVAGLFYFKETGSDENIVGSNIRNPGTPAAFQDPNVNRGEDFRNTSKALFVNLSYDILSNLTASAGYRFTKEAKHVRLAGKFLVSGLPFTSGTQEVTDRVPLYDAKLTWKATPDLLIYAKYGTGYRAGGIGFRAADTKFGPEEVKTYESGVKWDFNVGSMPARLNTALFRSNYENYQVAVTFTNPTRSTVINTGEALLRGAEFEFSIKPTSRLDVAASLGLLDAKYKSFTFTNSSFGGLVDLKNNKLRAAPKTTFSLSVGYTVPSSIGDWVFQADYNHTSSFEVDTVYQPGAPAAVRTNAFHNGPTDTVNARVKLAEAFGSNVDLSLWGKNLTDQAVLAYGLNVGTLRTGSYAEPRSFGVEVRAAF